LNLTLDQDSKMKKRHLSIFGWNKKRLSEKKSKRSSREIKPTLKQLHDAIYEEKIAQVKQIVNWWNCCSLTAPTQILATMQVGLAFIVPLFQAILKRWKLSLKSKL
jgi:hypothetical protein